MNKQRLTAYESGKRARQAIKSSEPKKESNMRKFRLIVNPSRVVLFLNTKNYSNIIGISSLYTAVAQALSYMLREQINGYMTEYTDGYIQIDFETRRF